ncbi:MAG: hypothetical protein K0R34_3653 [Herbinix sp.]|nr:hypothetical protein [Herbinix sp.]
MNITQIMNYKNMEYTILAAEQECIIHPIALGYLPYSSASLQCSFSSHFIIKDYQLLLSRLDIVTNEAMNLGGMHMEGYARKNSFEEFPVSYNGSILIGANIVKEYYLRGSSPSYFSYQKLIELVFENGILITTVDQSRAMLRIRKNLELGLRSLDNNRDKRCINRFMNSVLVGDYKPFLLQYNLMKYIKDMKQDYSVAYLGK